MDQVDKMRPVLLSLVEEGPEQEQLLQELNEINARFKKVFTWSVQHGKEIDDILPLSKQHEDLIDSVTAVNDDVEDEIKIKPRTGVNLKRIQGEIDRTKVNFWSFLKFP